MTTNHIATRRVSEITRIGRGMWSRPDPAEPACYSWKIVEEVRRIADLFRWHAGRCAICGRDEQRLVLDHDHRTGLVRGFLCSSDNIRESLGGGPFDLYHVKNPATMLGFAALKPPAMILRKELQPMDLNPRRVHRMDGFLPASGGRIRAVCSCGERTTPRASEDRALNALLTEHGYTRPACALCDRTHDDLTWEQVKEKLAIYTDPASRQQFLACRDTDGTCRDAADRRQTQLDRNALGDDTPKPRLRLIEGRNTN